MTVSPRFIAPNDIVIPRRRIASPHGGWLNSTVAKSTPTTPYSGMDRLSFVPNTDVRGLEFLFVNGYQDPTCIVIATGNALQFNLAVEVSPQLIQASPQQANGSPISTGGKTASVIADGQFLHTKPVHSGIFAAGVTNFYRVFKKVNTGEFWPMTLSKSWQNPGYSNTTDPVYGTTVKDGSDQTAAFSNQAWGAVTSTAYTWGATAIIAEQITPLPVVMITGDSIAAGNSDTVGRGYIGKACIDASIGYHNDGVGGCTIENLTKFGQIPQYLAEYADHVVIHCLTNSLATGTITTLAGAQAAVLSAAKAFSVRSNKGIWFSTVLPRTGPGPWSSYGVQTLPSWESLRVSINNWMRDLTASGMKAQLNASLPYANCGGYIDATPGIERNSDGSAVVLDGNGQQTGGGYWLLNRTPDGIHPDATAVGLMSPYVPTASFTL